MQLLPTYPPFQGANWKFNRTKTAKNIQCRASTTRWTDDIKGQWIQVCVTISIGTGENWTENECPKGTGWATGKMRVILATRRLSNE